MVHKYLIYSNYYYNLIIIIVVNYSEFESQELRNQINKTKFLKFETYIAENENYDNGDDIFFSFFFFLLFILLNFLIENVLYSQSSNLCFNIIENVIINK